MRLTTQGSVVSLVDGRRVDGRFGDTLSFFELLSAPVGKSDSGFAVAFIAISSFSPLRVAVLGIFFGLTRLNGYS